MDKIPTLFLRDPANMRLVTQEVNPEAAWVLEGHGKPTIKKDGTNIRVTVQAGKLIRVEKRRNPTRAEKEQGAEPGYVEASLDDPGDKHIFAAIDATNFSVWPDGASSCEALGPKIQGGIESDTPCLYPFSWRATPAWRFPDIPTFDSIKAYLEERPYEGIVWHHPDGRKAKIKRRDFNLPWPPKK
jgi:hypothetical protein